MVCNRGEIARRVIRTANHHGLETIAIYTQARTLELLLLRLLRHSLAGCQCCLL
jgi:pyruvate carboxylase